MRLLKSAILALVLFAATSAHAQLGQLTCTVCTMASPTITGTSTYPSGGTVLSFTNGTNNFVLWPSNGIAAPSFTTRSNGARIVIWPSLSGSSVDWSYGIETNFLWSAVANANTGTTGWKFYGGQTLEMVISGIGVTAHIVGNALTSATTIAPIARVTHVTGTTTIQTMTPTTVCTISGMACEIILIFDGVAPWNAAGNIFVAGTPTTAGTSVIFVYDNATSKWYPSRTL